MNNIPANTPDNVDMKIICEVSFFALIHELEDHLTRGWRIHPDYAPVANFTSFEVTLLKNRASMNRTRDRIDEVLGAREEANAEKKAEAAAKGRESVKEKTQQRKTGKNVQTMMESVNRVKEGGDEG